MKYCSSCGKQLEDDAVFCQFCGKAQNEAADVQREEVNQGEYQWNPANNTGVPQNRNREQQYQGQTYQVAPVDSGSFGWAVLGFFIPLVGLILWLVWKTERPLTAKKAGIGALVGAIVGVIFVIVETVNIRGAWQTFGNKENDAIIGVWQAFGTKVDDKIVPYIDTFDEETIASLEKQKLIFKSNDKVILKNGEVDIKADYEKDNDSYLVSFTFDDSLHFPDELQQLTCHIEGEYLIVDQLLPGGYIDYDPGHSVAYKRLD